MKVFAGEFFDGHPLALQVSRNPLGLVNRTETGYSLAVPEYRFTEYFEHEVLRKRPYLKKAWCIQVLENPIRSEPQERNRYRFWGKIEEFEGKILRVVTLADRITIHNAFPDRGFKS